MLTKFAYENSVYEAIEYAKSFYIGLYPKRPHKPFFNGKTATEAIEFAEKMKVYETEKSKYDSLKKEYYDIQNKVDSVIVEFIKDYSGLYTNVPQQYQEKVYTKAYQHGHSDGFYEVYLKLDSLIEIFN